MLKTVEVIEKCATDSGEIQLQRRGLHYEIISNGTFLMATYNGESERTLVSAALRACARPNHVLIGGLGVGFSLAEALLDERVKQVSVVEIEPKIIEWNKGYLNHFSGNAVENMRTRVIQSDLLAWMTQTDERFDAICLDIDNGPDWTVTESNLSLYTDAGLGRLKDMLTPGGVVSFWSAAPAPDFQARLTRNFSRVDEILIEQERGEPDCVYVAI